MWNRESSPVVTAHQPFGSLSSERGLYVGKSNVVNSGANLKGVKLAVPFLGSCTSVPSNKTSDTPGVWKADSEMQPSQAPQRANLREIKGKLFEVLGPERQGEYWRLLSGFLNFKLTKGELDALLPSAIGRENVKLHNQFVRAIFNNACSAEPPSRPHGFSDTPRTFKGLRKRAASGQAAQQDHEGAAAVDGLSARAGTLHMNGDAIAPHTRKHRSPGLRDRANSELARRKLTAEEDAGQPHGGVPNGEADGGQLGEPYREDPGIGRGTADGGALPPLPKRLRLDKEHVGEDGKLRRGQTDRPFLDGPTYARPALPFAAGEPSAGPLEHSLRECQLEQEREGEEAAAQEDEDEVVWLQDPVKASLGIPFCKSSPGASAWMHEPKPLPCPLTHSLLGEALDSDAASAQLPDAAALQNRMQRLAYLGGGLQAISQDAVQAVAAGLDAHLKSIIGACIRLVRARRHKEERWRSGVKPGAMIAVHGGLGGVEGGTAALYAVGKGGSMPEGGNGLWPHNESGAIGGDIPGQATEEAQQGHPPITMQDLMVAMELQPQLLGDEMAVSLERIALNL